jgi:hypothetical protein
VDDVEKADKKRAFSETFLPLTLLLLIAESP